MVKTLSTQCGCEVDEICVGMSALDSPADEDTRSLFTTGTLRQNQLTLQSDAYIALMLHSGRTGINRNLRYRFHVADAG